MGIAKFSQSRNLIHDCHCNGFEGTTAHDVKSSVGDLWLKRAFKPQGDRTKKMKSAPIQCPCTYTFNQTTNISVKRKTTIGCF
jgi:hypothetical protein